MFLQMDRNIKNLSFLNKNIFESDKIYLSNNIIGKYI